MWQLAPPTLSLHAPHNPNPERRRCGVEGVLLKHLTHIQMNEGDAGDRRSLQVKVCLWGGGIIKREAGGWSRKRIQGGGGAMM